MATLPPGFVLDQPNRQDPVIAGPDPYKQAAEQRAQQDQVIQQQNAARAAEAEARQRASDTWTVLSPEDVAKSGLPAGGTYQRNGLGQIKTVIEPSKTGDERKNAEALLRSAGVDLTSDKDPVADLISGSTSGALQSYGASAYGAVTGEATSGMENIARLQTLVSDMTLQLTGGGLGNQISDADREFIMQRVGNLGDPNIPANQRLAAWQSVKERLARALGVQTPTSGAGGEPLYDENGNPVGPNYTGLTYDKDGNPTLQVRVTDDSPPPPSGPVQGPDGPGFWQQFGAGVGDLVEGAAALPSIVTNPVGQAWYSALGIDDTYDTGQILRDALQLPQSDPNSFSSQVNQFGASALTGGGLARAGASIANPGTFQNVLNVLARTPIRDTAAGAGAGAGSYLGQQSGIPGADIAGMLLGGFAGYRGANAMMPSALNAAARAAPQASAAREIVEQGNQNNVRVFTTDVKPPASGVGKKFKQSFPESIPVAGMGGPRAAQQAERVEAVKSVVREFGGDDAKALFETGSSAVDDVARNLAETRGAQLSKLTGAKNAVIDKFAQPVPISRTEQAIDQQIAKLREINDEKLAPVIKELESWRRTLTGKNLRGLEENRKILGEAFNAPELASIKKYGSDALNPIYKALREDMGTFIQQNGGKADFNIWSKANAQLSAMAGELSDSAFKRVLNTAEMTPENVSKLLFSKKASDVQRVFSSLSPKGKQRAQAAILQRAFDGAISADKGLSVERFVNNLDRMSESVGVAFKGAERQRVEGLVKLLDATRRAAASQADPATGARLTLPIIGTYLGQALGFGAAVGTLGGAGVLARVYESPAVRDLLVKFSKAPAGSKAEGDLYRRILQSGAVYFEREMPNITKALNDNAQRTGAVAASPDEGPDQQ